MVPKSVSKTLYDGLCKLRYPYLRCDIPVGERIQWVLYDGFVDMVLPEGYIVLHTFALKKKKY